MFTLAIENTVAESPLIEGVLESLGTAIQSSGAASSVDSTTVNAVTVTSAITNLASSLGTTQTTTETSKCL